MSDIEFTAILPVGWERASGYSHGVKCKGGTAVYIAGKTGVAAPGAGAPADGGFAAQFDRALAKVVQVMRAAGGQPEHFTMMRFYVTDVQAYRDARSELGVAWRTHMGRHFPATTLLEVKGLLQPEALVEIDAEGMLP